jgi:hypothetical protein
VGPCTSICTNSVPRGSHSHELISLISWNCSLQFKIMLITFELSCKNLPLIPPSMWRSYSVSALGRLYSNPCDSLIRATLYHQVSISDVPHPALAQLINRALFCWPSSCWDPGNDSVRLWTRSDRYDALSLAQVSIAHWMRSYGDAPTWTRFRCILQLCPVLFSHPGSCSQTGAVLFARPLPFPGTF